MKLSQKDLLDRHKNEPAVVAVHGPSLNEHGKRLNLYRETKK